MHLSKNLKKNNSIFRLNFLKSSFIFRWSCWLNGLSLWHKLHIFSVELLLIDILHSKKKKLPI